MVNPRLFASQWLGIIEQFDRIRPDWRVYADGWSIRLDQDISAGLAYIDYEIRTIVVNTTAYHTFRDACVDLGIIPVPRDHEIAGVLVISCEMHANTPPRKKPTSSKRKQR